ncbi:portal protein [Liberibacter crescens]|nr:phage portal protein [Liberibacter crescens]
MGDDDFASQVSKLLDDAKKQNTERSSYRTKASAYYDGTMKAIDAVTKQGRSHAVSRDIRGVIAKILPSLRRVLIGSDKVVEYQPVGPEDEGEADQATDYVNEIVFPESHGYEAVEEALHDALLLRNGFLTWRYESRKKTETDLYTGLDQTAFVMLVSNDDVDVLEHSEQPQKMPDGSEEVLHDVRIRRTYVDSRVRIEAVPPEEFLISPEAVTIKEAVLVGRQTKLRRSDLIEMGYDRDVVDALPLGDSVENKKTFDGMSYSDRSLQEIDYYELYVRIDDDDDGIAELRRVVMAGGRSAGNILENEPWDEAPFASLICRRYPHRFEGESIYDDVFDIQEQKTVILRQSFDNLYLQNIPRTIVNPDVLENVDEFLEQDIDRPVFIKGGYLPSQAVDTHVVPMVADKSFPFMEYLDRELVIRTGISDASSGLDPEALQNMTATATALINQGGIGQTELMVATLAHGLKAMFRGVLRLITQHQDKPRTVRLRKQWVKIDPRVWNTDMDVTVNTGLGSGTKERDMMVISHIQQLQQTLYSMFGPDNPFLTSENIWNALVKLVEAAGIRNVEQYFTHPDPAMIQQRLQAAAGQTDPETAKIQAKAQAQANEKALDRQQRAADSQQKLAFEQQKFATETALKNKQLDMEQADKIALAPSGMSGSVHFGGQPG